MGREGWDEREEASDSRGSNLVWKVSTHLSASTPVGVNVEYSTCHNPSISRSKFIRCVSPSACLVEDKILVNLEVPSLTFSDDRRILDLHGAPNWGASPQSMAFSSAYLPFRLHSIYVEGYCLSVFQS